MQHRNVLHRGGERAARRGRAVYRRVRKQGTIITSSPSPVATLDLSESARYCQELTRREARNFYWGFLALPRRQRISIYALYSFSRQVDDAVDLGGSSSIQLVSEAGRRLREQAKRIEDCYAGSARDPVMRVLSEVVQEYGIPRPELAALVRGVEMDVEKRMYQDWTELQEYCRHVASAVGRMCTRIFGFTDPVALQMADDLGIALQITNILRDVREDLEMGRRYLPAEDLQRFGIDEAALASFEPGDNWPKLVEFEIERAHRYFESGLRILHYVPRRAAVCVMTMAGMYLSILNQIEEDPYLPLRRRARLRKRTKLKVMVHSWLRPV